MKVETRKFGGDGSPERRVLILLPTSVESDMIDWAVGDKVGEDGVIAAVMGIVKLEDGYATHYIQLEKASK